MFQSKLPKHFWSYVIHHATFLINRVSTPLLNNLSPYQVLYESLPDINDFKVFGSLCYASTLQAHRSKLDSRARICVFLGYNLGFKGFVLYDLNSREIFISKHVTFHDHILPYTNSNVTHWEYFPSKSSSVSHNESDSLPDIHPSTFDDTPSTTTPPLASPLELPPIIRSSRIRHPPSHLKDFVCHVSNQSSSPPSSTDFLSYPITDSLSYNKLSNQHLHSVFSLQTHTEPKSYVEASKFDCWKKTMETELTALIQTGTWKIVDLPPNIKPIGCRWVYKIKHHADGSIERFKARLVAKVYNQIEGLDYFDTYSLVAKMTTVRLVIALASIHHWFIHQLDVNNAFLHGQLQEDVYMQLPSGINVSKPNQVCKLVKSLYGLKQASRKWYERLTSLLLAQGYKHANSDHSLFTKSTATTFTVLLVYVDDIILVGNSISEFKNIKSILHASFKINDLGQLKYFLGLEVAHSQKGISLCPRK